MADAVLDALREKYPAYQNIPDDQLTLAIGKKYPQYLQQNKDFATSFQKLSAPPQPLGPPGPSGFIPPTIPDSLKTFKPHDWTPEELAKQNSSPTAPSEEGVLARLPRAIVADAAAGLYGMTHRITGNEGGVFSLSQWKEAANFSGNIPAALKPREDAWPYKVNELPIDQVIKQISTDKDEVAATTAAKISTGVANQLPTLALGVSALPSWAQKLVVAGFTLDMAKNVPKVATQLGDEMGKPKDEQDPDKISTLISDGIQQLVFATAGAKHLEGDAAKYIGKLMVDKYVPRGHGIDSGRFPISIPLNYKQPTTGVPNASQDTAPAAIHGDVRPQQEPASELPKQEGQPGVQPQAEKVAQEAQVSLTKSQQEAAENMWQGAADNVKERLLGDRSASSKAWADLTEEEQARVAEKTGVTRQKPIEQVNLTGVERPAAKTSEILSDPDHQRMLELERGNTDVPVDVMGKEDFDKLESEDPFAKSYEGQLGRALRRGIATVDRKTGRIVVNKEAIGDELNSVPATQRQKLLRSTIGEERIHLATDDAAAKTYWDNLTGLEKAVSKRRHGERGSDLLNGHEAIRYQLQRLARMTPRETILTAGSEKWTMKGLTILESTVRGIREALGTKASYEQKGILDAIQNNLKTGKLAAGGSMPGAIDKKVQELSEEEARKLDEQAAMYLESGDAESANELKKMAQKLRSQTGEQYFPMAQQKEEPPPGERIVTVKRPDGSTYEASFGGKYYDFTKQGRGKVPSVAFLKEGKWSHGILPQGDQIQENFPMARPIKRKESIFQEKFTLPGMETVHAPGQQALGATSFTPEGELKVAETPAVPKEERVSAEASGALPRLTGAELGRRGVEWAQQAFRNALTATEEGKHPEPPKFKDFVDYMKRQEPKLQAGQLYEMWQKQVAGWLDKASGKELSDLSKSLFGRESIFGRATIADVPEGGFKLEHVADRTRAEEYQDQRRMARTKAFREKVMGALYKKLVQPQLKDESLSAERKTITPSEIRYGANYHFFDAKAQNDKHLGDMLVEEARQSKDDPASLTKRLTVVQDKRTGQVEMLSTYKHPSLGVVMRDPLSPRGESSPLSTMLNRYRVLQSIPLDQPVKSFRQSFGSLGEFNEKFGNEARENYNRETSYNPQQVSLSEFLESTTGRVEGPETSTFQGPHRDLVEEGGEGELERGERTPITGPEAESVFNFLVDELGRDPTSADDVEEAINGLSHEVTAKKNRQAISAIAKLGRAIGEEYPFASGEELKGKLADRIFQAHKDSSSLEQFQQKLMSMANHMPEENFPMARRKDPADWWKERGGEDEEEEGFEWPSTKPDLDTPVPEQANTAESVIRNLYDEFGGTIPYDSPEMKGMLRGEIKKAVKRGRDGLARDIARLAPLVREESNGGLIFPAGQQNFPMARAKQPGDDYKAQARQLDDDLFKLSSQYLADVEQAFPQVEELRKKYEKEIPPAEVERVYHKLDEEFTLGHSDISLSSNGQKLFDEASNLFAINRDMYEMVKDINPEAVQEWESWPRMAKDVNSIFARVARGVKRGITEGNIFSKGAWFTKRRVIKALVDDQGNRQVAVMTPDGKMIGYTNGKGTDLGDFAWSDVVKREEKYAEELKPIVDEVEELNKERSILTRTESREAVSGRRIKNIDKRLAELELEKQSVDADYPLPQLDDKVWTDKNGKQWKMADATTGEIEKNMDVRFYKEPFSILIAHNLKLKQMLRAANWLEKFKKTPQFNRIARRFDERNIPPDWKRVEVPQLRNYVFEPHLADVLNQFHERSKGKDPNILTSMNRLLMNAVFFDNPFLHSPNLAGWWLTSRGALAWVNPRAWGRMLKTFPQAFKDVSEKTPAYVKYLRSGTPLQYTRMRDFSDNITKILAGHLEQDPTLSKRLSNFLGYANPVKLMQAIGHASTAGLHDVLTLQLIREVQLKYPGLKNDPTTAMKMVTKIMPDYRIPARVLGSRNLSKLVANPNAVWFGAYHFAEGKAFRNMAKGLLAGKELSRGEALDKIAATALLAYVAYPIMDDLLKKLTGRKDLSFRRAGSATWPTAIGDVLTGRRTPTQVMPSFMSPSAATTAALSLLYNTALGNRGMPIYNPRAGIGQSAKDIGKFVGEQFNQGQVYRDITSGKYDWDQLFENLIGVRKDYSKEPSSQIYGWAYDWAKATNNQKLLKQFNERAMEVYPPSKYAPLKNFLASGDNAKAAMEIRKLLQSGTTPQLIERELRPDAHPLSGLKGTEAQFVESLSPEQQRVYYTEQARREKVYQHYLELSGQ